MNRLKCKISKKKYRPFKKKVDDISQINKEKPKDHNTEPSWTWKH